MHIYIYLYSKKYGFRLQDYDFNGNWAPIPSSFSNGTSRSNDCSVVQLRNHLGCFDRAAFHRIDSRRIGIRSEDSGTAGYIPEFDNDACRVHGLDFVGLVASIEPLGFRGCLAGRRLASRTLLPRRKRGRPSCSEHGLAYSSCWCWAEGVGRL